jgi:hypothetical protein
VYFEQVFSAPILRFVIKSNLLEKTEHRFVLAGDQSRKSDKRRLRAICC